jgi:F0F1-type ATP synthase assembly protein I
VIPAGERRDQKTWSGFSDALARAVEFAGTTVICALVGLFIDSRLGTRPLFFIIFGMLAIVGLSVSAYYRYKDDIAREEEGKPWKHKPR